MKNRSRLILFVAVALLFVVPACTMPFLDGGADDEDNSSKPPQIVVVEPGQQIPQEEEQPAEENTPREEQGNAKEIDPDPVGIQDGLGSLDSYKFYIRIKTNDEKGAINDMESMVQRSAINKEAYSMTTITTFDPEEDEEINTETTESYSVDTATCTHSDDDWDLEELSGQDKEMRDIFSSMIDFIPLIEDPVFAGEETMNGILCNHFTFRLNGIGDTSGSVATINQGEYWLAKDGQYIVRYSLKLEVRSAAEGTPGAEVAYLESYADLTDVNVPVTVTIPAECYIPDDDE